MAKAVGEKETLKRIEKIKDSGRQSDAQLLHMYGQNKKATGRAMDKTRNDMEEVVYNKLEEGDI